MNIKINRSKDIQATIQYNEEKRNMSVEELKIRDPEQHQALLEAGKLPSGKIAKLISHNLPPHFDNLDRSNAYMQKVADRADNSVTLVASHIKISLHADDKIDEEQFVRIGEDVLNELGYSDNPYLLYQHLDTFHPHAHLVTTTVKKNGKHVPSSYEGLDSNKLEEKLERKYNLIRKKDQQIEVDGIKNKSWSERRIALKTGIETYHNIIRKSILDSFDRNMDLNLFAQSLSRAGIGLHISKFKTKDMQTKYGIYYNLDPKKIRFKFSESTHSMPPKFQGKDIPESAFKNYLLGRTDGISIPNNSGENNEYNFSRNFFNEVYIAESPLVHPPSSDLEKFYMKGNQVGSGFSFYGLKNRLGFSEDEAETYRHEGNDNSLIHERPEESKLLYSLQRGKADCVREAFEEGASLSRVEENYRNYIQENYSDVWHYLVQLERETKEKKLQNSISPQKGKIESIKKEKSSENQKKKRVEIRTINFVLSFSIKT